MVLLKCGFKVLLEALSEENVENSYSLAFHHYKSTLVIAATANDLALKEKLLSELNFSVEDLAFSSIITQERSCIILFLRTVDEKKREDFIRTLESFLASAYFDNQQVIDAVLSSL